MKSLIIHRTICQIKIDEGLIRNAREFRLSFEIFYGIAVNVYGNLLF